MFFKNVYIYRLENNWKMTADQLAQILSRQAFQPASSLDMTTAGWAPPVEGGTLVHNVNRQMLISLHTEKKLLPASVINHFTKARVAEIEDQQGFKPGKKQVKELKEQVTDELLPRAFSIYTRTNVWIDQVNGWLVIDAASPSKADDVVKYLLKSLEKSPISSLRTARSPIAAMTDWLASDEAPADFTIDQETELRATGEGKATVRFVRHTIDAEDVRRHIAAGKQCTRLAMTWSDKISFVLTESLAIKRVAPLDVLKEGDGADDKDAAARFDTEFMLMTGELDKLLKALVAALGGEQQEAMAA